MKCVQKVCSCIKQRYVLASLSFLGFMNMMNIKLCLNIAIIPMTDVNHTTISGHKSTTVSWDTKNRGLILSMLTFGGAFSPIIGATLTRRKVFLLFSNPKVIYGFGVFGSSILSILSPLLAKKPPFVFMITRFAQGFLIGFPFGVISELWSAWAPRSEVTKLTATTATGLIFGNSFAMLFSGLLIDYVSWEVAFYATGCSGILWSLCWTIFVSDTPNENYFISKSEEDFITEGTSRQKREQNLSTPWREIFKSKPVWGILISTLCAIFSIQLIATDLPRFITNTVGISIRDTALVYSVSYLVSSFLVQLATIGVDKIRALNHPRLTNTIIRKLFLGISGLLTAICILLLGFTYKIKPITLTIVFFSILATSLYQINIYSNLLDLAPKFANTIQSVIISWARLFAALNPIFVGIIVNKNDPRQWNYMFYLTSSAAMFGVIMYTILGSGELQEWAKEPVNLSKGKVADALVIES